MRPIKFRGKDCHGNWRYGACVKVHEELQSAIYFPVERKRIVTVDWCYVAEDTIGQYVFKTHVQKDRKVHEIYEGDILRGYQPYHEDTPITGVVKWDEDTQRFILLSTKNYVEQLVVFSVIEVIGNIHDNPELMKEQK